MTTIQIIIIAFISFITQLIEALAGFGATAIGLPFAALVVDVKVATTVLNLNAFIVTTYFLITKWRQVNWREYIKIVLIVLPFLPLGFWIMSGAKPAELKIALALLMIFISLRALYYAYLAKDREKPMHPVVQYIFLGVGGIVHGIFASGGPLITVYSKSRMHDKGEFRATMCACWTTINAFSITMRYLSGYFTSEVNKLILYSLPFLIIGVIVGSVIHRKVHNDTFSKIVYFILLAGGIAALIK